MYKRPSHEITALVEKADALVAEGKSVAAACREVGIGSELYSRRKQKTGGRKLPVPHMTPPPISIPFGAVRRGGGLRISGSPSEVAEFLFRVGEALRHG